MLMNFKQCDENVNEWLCTLMFVYFLFCMPNDACEHMKMLLNVNKNAKIVIESELSANVRFLALRNASSRYLLSIHANECVFSRNEQQKVY